MMKRRLAKLLVFLLLLGGGALVNVAVAWGCAMPPARRAIPESFAAPAAWPGHVDKTWPAAERGSVFVTLGVTYFVTGGAEPTMTSPRHEYWQELVQYGWPNRSMEVERLEDRLVTWPPYEIETQRYLKGGLVFRSSSSLPTRFLPLRPIWPGFAINTVFYAGVLWLLFAFGGTPFALRRRRRIKRGKCARCGYPWGTGAVCSECGSAIVGRTAAVHGAPPIPAPATPGPPSDRKHNT